MICFVRTCEPSIFAPSFACWGLPMSPGLFLSPLGNPLGQGTPTETGGRSIVLYIHTISEHEQKIALSNLRGDPCNCRESLSQAGHTLSGQRSCPADHPSRGAAHPACGVWSLLWTPPRWAARSRQRKHTAAAAAIARVAGPVAGGAGAPFHPPPSPVAPAAKRPPDTLLRHLPLSLYCPDGIRREAPAGPVCPGGPPLRAAPPHPSRPPPRRPPRRAPPRAYVGGGGHPHTRPRRQRVSGRWPPVCGRQTCAGERRTPRAGVGVVGKRWCLSQRPRRRPSLPDAVGPTSC